MLYVVAHGLRRDYSFPRRRNVAGPGRNHDDLSLAVHSLVLSQRDGAGKLMKYGLAKLCASPARNLLR